MTPTPPTRRQRDEMTRVQSEKRAQNDAAQSPYEECYVCGRPMDGLSEDDCHCFHFKQLKPAPSAGTCITPSQGAPE